MSGHEEHRLADRGRDLIASPPAAEYIRTHQERATDPFDTDHKPGGYVALCTAENKLVADLVLERLSMVADVPARALGYDNMVGAAGVRARVGAFMERTFIGRPVDPEHLILLAGAGAAPLTASSTHNFSEGQKCHLAIRPEKVQISAEKPEDADNAVQGKVLDIAYLGNLSTYNVEVPSGLIIKAQTANTRRIARRDFTWEDTVWLSWTATAGVLLAE